MKGLVQALPLLAVGAIVAGIGWQYWQQREAAKPNYDNPTSDAAATAASASTLPPQLRQSETWQVVRVTDGDTIVVRSGGQEERVRFCGIDAPEVAHAGKLGQPLGDAAKAYLTQLVGGKTVTLVPVTRDRYGRMVAEVFVAAPTPQQPEQEQFVNAELVQAGMAYVYPRYVGDCPNGTTIQQVEATAQARHVGVWNGDYQRPWDFRRANRR